MEWLKPRKNALLGCQFKAIEIKQHSYVSETIDNIETKKSFRKFNKFDQLNQSNKAKGVL